ncbi:MAG TPA: choice-of-anchor J domain-containing protein [Bacteroidales bacterium]|nr:choice-of-anchor J domain-containing protein [Bacteroidales bacterium]
MKKVYMFMTLLLLSGVLFAQVQRAGGSLVAVDVAKEINTTQASMSKAVVDSLHYDGINDDGIGTGSAADFGVYAFFPETTLAAQAALSHYILSVKVYINGASTVSAAQLRFYTDTLTSAMVYSQNFTPVEGWNNVVLTAPYAIPATGNLYVGYNVTVTTGYPAGCDAGPANPNGNWIFMGNWAHLSDLSATLDYNWNIRAMVGTLPTTPTASCTPLTWDAGTMVLPNSVTSANFTLANAGSGTLTCSGITGISAPFTTTFVPGSVNLATGASYTFTFTYAPTAVGTDNQTVVIATNGGDITINLSGSAVTCNAINSFPWTESFEGATWPPACWVVESPDGGTGWASIASGTTPLPGWNGGTMTVPTGGGNNAAFCTWSTGGASANDQWLITPQISVQANQALSFYVFWFGHYAENVDIKVSTTTNASASFTTNLLTTDTTNYVHEDWTLITAPLTAYSGQDIYIAFNEHVTDNSADGAFIGIDLVTVAAGGSGISETKEELVSIFPNPANDKLYIAASKVKSVEIYNLSGAIVASYGNVNVVNTSDIAVGAYVVKVITESKVTTQKVNIVR